MSHTITIKFYRNSRNARKIESIAKDFRHLDLTDDLNKPCQIHITKDSSIDDMKLFNYFWGIIKKYKETAIYANGKILTRKQAEDILNWVQCCSNREYFENQADYCCISPGIKHMHGWGCKWLHSILRHTRFGRHNGVHWYKIGPFDGKIQYIDKQAIKDKLTAEADSKCLSLCPLFSLEKAYRYVDLLPDQLDPEFDTEWEYENSSEPENKSEIIGVKPKSSGILDLMF